MNYEKLITYILNSTCFAIANYGGSRVSNPNSYCLVRD